MNTPSDGKSIRVAEYAILKLLGQTVHPFSSMVASGLKEDMAEEVVGHGIIGRVEGTGFVLLR